MKRLVISAACLAMLTLTGCANGLFGGGLFNNDCNTRQPVFGNGLFSDGPVRQFLRGDACDSCNAAAGQIPPACEHCGNAISPDPYAPVANPVQQPVTSFYPGSDGVSLGQPLLQSQGLPVETQLPPGSINGFGAIEEDPSNPPGSVN